MHPEAYKQLIGGELPQLLTVREACRYLSCSRSHFYALRIRKLIDTVKLGNATRVRRSELERYVGTLPGARDGNAG